MEILGDRVLLSASAVTTAATDAPPPASRQAVESFLKWQGDFIKFTDGVLATEQKMLNSGEEIKLSGTPLSPSAADYFLKLDTDLITLDGDLIGGQTPTATTGATAPADTVGGIDGTIIGYKLSSSGRAAADAAHIQADFIKLTQMDAVLVKIAQGDQGATGGAADAVDAYLKFEGIKHKEQAAAIDLNTTFIKLEEAFVGSDLEQSVDSLGSDLAMLPNDTAPQNPPAFDAFLKFEEDYLKVQNSFIKFEGEFLKHKAQIASATADYFIKLDADYIKIDVDLAGTPPAANPADAVGVTNVGGINGVLINSNLPADVIAEIQNKWSPLLFKAQAELTADIAALKAPVAGGPAATSANDVDLENGRFKVQIGKVTAALDAEFMKFEAAFLEGDRPLVDALLTDLNTLAADAANKTTET